MLLLMSNNLQHCESWRERLASRHPSVSSDQVEFEAAQKAEAAQKNGGFEGQTDRQIGELPFDTMRHFQINTFAL